MLPSWTTRQRLYHPNLCSPGNLDLSLPAQAPLFSNLSSPAAGALISLVISLLRAEEALQ